MVQTYLTESSKKIAFLSVVILACSTMIFYFSLPKITIDRINSLEVSPEVFAIILVSLSVILFEFSRIIKESADVPSVRNKVLKETEKIMFFFEMSIIFTMFGLFASVAGSTGFAVLFFLFFSILTLSETTTYILKFRASYLESKVKKKKR